MNKVEENSTEREAEFGMILGEIFKHAAISRLVMVDDDYAETELGHEEIIAQVIKNKSKFEPIIPDLKELDEDEDDLISSVTSHALRDPSVLESASALCVEDLDDLTTDQSSENAIQRLVAAVPDENAICFEKMSSKKWNDSFENILKESEQQATLVLFDRDFSREGKDANYGLELISKLLSESDENVYCALLSHTVSSDSEIVKWHQLSDEFSMDRDRFVVIAKTRLAEERPDFPGFLRLLRLSILCQPLKKLRDKTLEHYRQAVDTTGKNLSKWSVFDFDEAVFGSSRSEGLWEGETLLRVMSTFTTQSARKSVLGDGNVRNLISHAKKASSISIPTDEKTVWRNAGEMALNYQRTESYAFADDINPHHLPLEAGDVFGDKNGNNQYILLAQPCDLMVRKDGKRSNDDKNTRMVPICQIKKAPPAGDNRGNFYYELPHWFKDGTPGYVVFRDVHLVSLSVMDFVVFNKSGEANFDLYSEPEEELSDSLKNRHQKLYRIYRKVHQNLCEIYEALNSPKINLNKQLKDFGKLNLLPQCSNTNKFKLELVSSGFRANIKRTARVSSPIATDVLRAYSHYQSRTAFDQSLVTNEVSQNLGDAN